MDAAVDYYDFPSYAYSSVPNDTNYENVSGEVSSHNTTDYGSKKGINDNAVINVSIVVISIFGAVGNGIVIWLLGFHIKRNPFSTYILNLAVADLGVLLSLPFIVLALWIVFLYDFLFLVFLFLFQLTFSASQFLLTAISVDRCVAVFCPLWHRCHRPPGLSAIACALIWLLAFLLTAIIIFLISLDLNEAMIVIYQFIVNALLCLPVMTVATVALFIRVCFKARQHRRGKLLTIILVTLLFFLLFAFPLNAMVILKIFKHFPQYMLHGAMLLACINSSVNPSVYILVGRQWKCRQSENVRMIFQEVFKEEDSQIRETPVETRL